MREQAAATVIDSLPVIAEEPDDGPVGVSDKAFEDRFGEFGVGVLIFIDEYVRVALRDDAAKFRLLQQQAAKRHDVVMMKRDALVLDRRVAEVVFDPTTADRPRHRDPLSPTAERWQFAANQVLKVFDD